MSRRNQERVARKLMELEKGLSGLARARQVAFSDVPVATVDEAGNPVESDVPIPELFGDIQIDVEQFKQDVAEARERLDEAREELDSLADGSHEIYDEIRDIEETLDGTVRVHRTPERPTDLNDTSDLADLWVNPSDPSDIWRWEGSSTGWVKQDDPDLSEFYQRMDAAETALTELQDDLLPALEDELGSIPTVTWGAAPKAAGAPGKAGDTHFVFSGDTATGVQRHSGTAWGAVGFGHQMLASLDLGKATVGELNGGRITAGSITADRLNVGDLVASLVAADLLNALTANIQDAWIEQAWIKSLVVNVADVEGLTFTNASGRFLRADLFAANSITADKLVVASSENALTDPNFESPESWLLMDGVTLNGGGFDGLRRITIGASASQRGAYLGGSDAPTSAASRIPVRPGDMWRVEAKVRSASPIPSGTGNVALYARFYATREGSADSAPLIGGADSAIASGTWGNASGSIVVPDGANFMAVGFYSQSAQNAVVWWSAPVARLMAGATLIEPGAITSEKITANELTGLDIVGSKFRLLGDDGSEAVVLAPGTANFAVFGSAEKNVSISSDGQIGAEVGAFNEITYAGESLNVILNDRPKGVVYDATFTPADSSVSSTQYRSVFGAQFELEEERRYLITCETGGNILAYKNGSSLTLNADIRCMPTTGLPGLNDISTGRIYWDQQQATRDMDRVFDFSRVYNVRAGRETANMHNLLPGLNSIRAKIWRPTGSGTFGVTSRGAAGRFTVIDVGPVLDDFLPSITDTRTSGSGGGDSDTGGGQRSYTKTYNATWSQSYLGGGGQRPDGTNYLYQGYTSYYPAGGTQRSQIGFNDSQIRSDLSGAEIQSVEVYVFYEHWWSGAGGNARIGTHSNSNKPGSWSGANTAYYSDSTNWPRGSGRWVRLNNAEGDRFKSGNARGITLNAINTSNTYYGYARGVGQSNAPKLRIKYRK